MKKILIVLGITFVLAITINANTAICDTKDNELFEYIGDSLDQRFKTAPDYCCVHSNAKAVVEGELYLKKNNCPSYSKKILRQFKALRDLTKDYCEGTTEEKPTKAIFSKAFYLFLNTKK